MDERLRFVARLLDGEKMAALCREFDVSRKTGYKIFQRYKDCGLEGLTDRSRRPYRQANQLPLQIEKLIVQLKRERQIAALALQNIVANVERLVKQPETRIVHVTALAESVREFQPHAIVLSGTLRDFDYYKPEILENFAGFIRQTTAPVLGICGGHQLIGLSFGAGVITLDSREQREQRDNRITEYQYRLVRITDPSDPIFAGIDNPQSSPWQDYTREGRILRVWQNHGLQLDRLPEGFTLLATSYLCKNQMMVKREQGQLIYTVQFHLEKSFEDWNKSRTRWEHQNESRDGRVLFENFLRLAVEYRK